MTSKRESSGRPQVSAQAMNEATRALAPSSLDGAPAFIGMCDAQFHPTYLNPAGRSMVCFPEMTPLTQVGIRDFFVPEHRQVIEAAGLPTMAREGRWEQDLRFRDWHDPAHEIDVRCSIFGLYDEQKRFLAGVTITHEIRNLTKTERAMRDSRVLVDSILEKLPVGVGVFDAKGHLVHANDGWRRRGVFSLPSRVPTNSQRWKGLGERALPSPQESGSRALRGESVSTEQLFSAADGTPPGWVRISAAPLAAKHEPSGAVVVLLDVDELRRTKAQLARSEARFSVAAEIANFGIFNFDPSTGACEWDDRLRKLWGLTHDAPVDWEVFQDAIHPEDAARVRAAIGSCMSSGRSQQFTIGYRIVRRDDGSLRNIATTFRSIFEGTDMSTLIGASIDVTGHPTPGPAPDHAPPRYQDLSNGGRPGVRNTGSSS